MTRTIAVPWTNVYGLARTLVALGTAGTLAFSSAETLFRPVATVGPHPACEGPSAAGVFCLAPDPADGYTGLTWVKWGCMAVLLLVASGWRPRFTALPHAYIAFSVYTGIAIGDGGDQLALVLAVLLALPALGDSRRWHWQPPDHGATARSAGRAWALIGASALIMVKLQMSFLYFQAAVAKLPHAEWADGTAMWYWGTSLAFGPPPWLAPLFEWVVSTPWGVAALTWVPLFIEISLAATLLLPQRARWAVMAAGVGFHLMIATVMGLWSFALTVAGGILVLCCPLGAQLRRRHPVESGDGQDGDTVGEESAARQSDTKLSVSASDMPSSRASATS